MTRKRKDEGFIDELLEFLLIVPSWVGPPLALLFYLVLRFLLPAVLDGGDEKTAIVGSVFGGLSQTLALPLAGVVLFLWLIAEFQKWRRRGLLNSQSGLDSIRNLTWQEFEHLVGEAYRRRGYAVQETGSASGDGGIDLSLSKGNERVLVQCKRWRTRRVGVKPVRELFGVMTSESATRSILVTCGSFTREAKLFADGKPLDLVEGAELWELVQSVKHAKNMGNSPGKPLTEIPPRAAARGAMPDAAPRCPACDSPMILRTARKGSKAGSQFFGCSRYPHCRGTRDKLGI